MINIVAFISNLALLVAGSVWLFQTFGWFTAGVVTAIALISGFNTVDIIVIDDEDV